MISIVCVYNNKEILDKFLIKSLNHQTKEYELILMDNTKKTFKSAAEALNKGGMKATGDYIMFVHQDVDLTSDSWLDNTESLLDTLSNPGIIGVAGCLETKNGTVTIIKDGVPPKIAGIYTNKIKNVQTLDECLLITPKSVFNLLKFDEQLCDNWHLYGADYCLTIKKMGFNVFMIPMYIYHNSTGYFSDKYYYTLKKLLKKHQKSYEEISTTTGIWKTRYPLFLQKALKLLKSEINK
jgi:hypothetical protein